MNKLLNKIISEVSLDERVSNGMFNVEEDMHMEALRDYLVNKGIDEDSVRSFSNKILEGKYPERQAYNINGILVTFPTPEYKKQAINRGTHFEENPIKKTSNIFSDPAKSDATPDAPPDATTDTTPPKDAEKTTVASNPNKLPIEPKTNLPVSQIAPPSSGDTTVTNNIQVKTTAAPQQTPTPNAEPIKEPSELPEPPPKSPDEKEADKKAIKTMLKGDDYMLDEMVDWFMYNAPKRLLEIIKVHKKKL